MIDHNLNACETMEETADLVFDRVRPKLTAIAYRMLGTVMDAEDVVQDAFVKWSTMDRSNVENPDSYLSSIVTRLSIDLLRKRSREREEYEGPWLPEPLVVQPTDLAELSDSLSTAFLLLLERLSPSERAVFLLREIFSYDYPEIASMIDRSEANCRQILKRAKDRISGEQVGRFEADQETHRRLTETFLSAASEGNLEALLGVLAEDVELRSDHGGKAPAARKPLFGSEIVSRFVLGLREKSRDWDVVARVLPMNGGIGIAFVLNGALQSVFRFEVAGGRISRIYATLNPEKLRHVEKMLKDQ